MLRKLTPRRSMVAGSSPPANLVADERPDEDVLACGVVEQRRLGGQLDPVRRGHRVAVELRLGGLEGPRRMVDVGAQNAPAIVGQVEAVALGEEVLERAGLSVEARSGRPVA